MAFEQLMPPKDSPVDVFRVVPYDRWEDPLVSREKEGRYHDYSDPSDYPTGYCSLGGRTAILEVSHGRWNVTPQRYRMLRVRLNLPGMEVLSIYDPELAGLLTEGDAIEPNLLAEPQRTHRLAVARHLRGEGANGLWAPSRIDYPDGVNLVLFLNNARQGSAAEGGHVEILNENDVDALLAGLDELKRAYGEDWLSGFRAK